MMNKPKDYAAFIFDLNGTMIDDMSFHINAWHRILNELGASISLERTRQECYGKNHELLERIFPGRFSLEEKDQMSMEKEKQYQEQFRPHLKLIPGLDRFLEKAHRSHKKMAVGSAAILYNIDFVLDGLDIRRYISTVISAEDVEESKPHPETFIRCAERLGLRPEACLVFEDAPKGVEAARNAGMDSVVITTLHEPEEFRSYDNVIHFISNFEDPFLRQLL